MKTTNAIVDYSHTDLATVLDLDESLAVKIVRLSLFQNIIPWLHNRSIVPDHPKVAGIIENRALQYYVQMVDDLQLDISVLPTLQKYKPEDKKQHPNRIRTGGDRAAGCLRYRL